LLRDNGHHDFYDIEKDVSDIAYWINKASLNKNGDDLNRETDVIAKLLNEAKGILYFDRSD
jgi:hypothetical protein